MTDYPRKTRPTLTLVGFPIDLSGMANERRVPDESHANDARPYLEHPFPLHPYVACGDSHTPSHEVNRAEPTAPLPEARQRRHTPEELVIIRELDRCRRLDKRPGMEPSTLAKATAGVFVVTFLYVLLLAWWVQH